jgi:hypothetical protein
MSKLHKTYWDAEGFRGATGRSTYTKGRIEEGSTIVSVGLDALSIDPSLQERPLQGCQNHFHKRLALTGTFNRPA